MFDILIKHLGRGASCSKWCLLTQHSCWPVANGHLSFFRIPWFESGYCKLGLINWVGGYSEKKRKKKKSGVCWVDSAGPHCIGRWYGQVHIKLSINLYHQILYFRKFYVPPNHWMLIYKEHYKEYHQNFVWLWFLQLKEYFVVPLSVLYFLVHLRGT